jgi:hypothetical protein
MYNFKNKSFPHSNEWLTSQGHDGTSVNGDE